MHRILVWGIVVCTALFCFSLEAATTHLVAIGGGEKPPEALKRFVEWAGGKKARILVISWANEVPTGEDYKALRDDLKPLGAERMTLAPLPAELESKQDFDADVEKATGIFFTGGDQNRIMTLVKRYHFLSLFQEAYRRGVVVGGTSAGASVLSATMVTGREPTESVGRLAPEKSPDTGLALLPDIYIDQHFMARSRENRFLSILFSGISPMGIGIDEGTAIAVEDDRVVEVMGKGKVLFMDTKTLKGRLVGDILSAGQKYNLALRQPISEG